MPLRFSGALPVFASVIIAGGPLDPIWSGEKFCRAGYIIRKAPLTPLPFTEIATGLTGVLSVTVIVPDSDPVLVGENVTLTAQLDPGVSGTLQVSLSAKFALALMLGVLILTLLGLLMVMV